MQDVRAVFYEMDRKIIKKYIEMLSINHRIFALEIDINFQSSMFYHAIFGSPPNFLIFFYVYDAKNTPHYCYGSI
ncbi:MAG: hypothetical protein RL023_521 [Candidatus Parcubacteria bacterium]|jgi:hypothetical protein